MRRWAMEAAGGDGKIEPWGGGAFLLFCGRQACTSLLLGRRRDGQARLGRMGVSATSVTAAREQPDKGALECPERSHSTYMVHSRYLAPLYA